MRYVFITGMGRSGTKFLSSLLSIDNDVISNHEYIGNREYWLLSWYLGNMYNNEILRNAKNKIESKFYKKTFIDVNGYLSDSTDSLKEVFDNPKIFHLVRNPKKVVPSLMIRRDDEGIHKIPKNEAEIKAWIKMSNLEQICINWVQTTEDLLNSNTELLFFEKLISDYNYLSDILLKPIDLNISEEQYNKLKSKKINKTKSWLYRYLYAKYNGKRRINKTMTFEKLDDKQRDAFYSICGKTMEKLGYKL